MAFNLKLGGIELNPAMIWTDRYTSSKVAQSSLRTLGGGIVVYSQQLLAGTSITLVGNEETGWLTKEQVDDVMELADQAGAVFVLEYDAVSYQVVFRHHESPAFEAAPLIPRINQESGDFMTATIKLMTV